ncbi:MAG: protein tyrosine phosphatase family protein [Pseudomonadales bacterium]
MSESDAPASNALPLTNFYAITDDIGTAGQPRPEQFALIAEAGYQTVVNLALPDSEHAIPDEGSIVTGLGMRYVHIPVQFDAPTLDDLRAFTGILQGLSGTRVLVHCVVNARVSAFVYLYLRHVRALPELQCRTPLLDRWQPQMDDVWSRFIAQPGAALES